MRSRFETNNEKLEPKWVNVLAGDVNENIVDEMIGELLNTPDSPINIEYCICLKSSEILLAAKSGEFDLILLILNNIIFDGSPSSPVDKSEKALQFVQELSQIGGLPIVALYGHPRDPEYANRAILAGATYATVIPCDFTTLRNEVLAATTNKPS